MKYIKSLVSVCVQRGYVTQERAPWLQYAIEKRVSSLIVFSLLIVLGMRLAPTETVMMFIISFCTLRSKTSGVHAKTLLGCIVYSIGSEIFFLKVLPLLWNHSLSNVFLGLALGSIRMLAPYNHPNMNLSVTEAKECKKKAKKLSECWFIAIIMLRILQLTTWADGIVLGIIMSAFMLVLAYITILIKMELYMCCYFKKKL